MEKQGEAKGRKKRKKQRQEDATEGLPPRNLNAAGIDVGNAEHVHFQSLTLQHVVEPHPIHPVACMATVSARHTKADPSHSPG